MLKSKLNQLRASEGFTIIEVIIVLVIAAVIMLAVFLVVPALQRQQRNTRRANDARRLITNMEQIASQNNGTYPADFAAAIANIGTFTDPATGNTYAGTWGNGTVAPAVPTAAGTMAVGVNFVCNGNTFAGTATTGRYSVVVFQEGGAASYCVNN